MLNTLSFITSEFQILIIAGLILLLFGAKKVPEFMRGIGRGVGELHKGLEEGKRMMTDAAAEPTVAEKKPEEAAK